MISAAIIGLGQIGYEYDFNKGNLDLCLSHFTALKNSKEFRLKYVVDKEIKNKRGLSEVCFDLGIGAYSNVRDLPKPVDLLVLSVPPSEFLKVFSDYMKKFSCKYIVGEKLGMLDEYSIKVLMETITSQNIQVFSNYYRRTLPETHKLYESFLSKKIRLINCIFTNKPENTLPHFIDLISYLLSAPPSNFERNGDNFLAVFGDVKCTFINLKNVLYDHYTLDIFGEDLYVNFSMDGLPIEFKTAKNDHLFSNHKILKQDSHMVRSSSKSIMFFYKQIFAAIINGSQQVTTFQEDLKNLKEFRNLV